MNPSAPTWAVTDPRSEFELAQDRTTSDVQRSTAGRVDPGRITAALIELRSGRAGNENLLQFDLITEGERVTALVARGELIVRSGVLSGSAQLQSLLQDAGFTPAEVPEELTGQVERLINTSLGGPELDAFARDLRSQGFPVSVNHIAPLGYWIKSEDGPEHTTWRQDPPAVPLVSGPIVAVIDTGIVGAGIRTDGWLDEIRRDTNIDELDGPDPGTELDLGAGHGTFTAGIIRQVAPSATIVAIKALDSTGMGSEVGVGAAMVRAVRGGARILSLSLGTQSLDDQPPIAFEVALELIDAYHGEHGAGADVLIVAAAGNFGNTRPCWPAAFPRVVSVAALTAAAQPTDWSSRGWWVDCSVVGEGISSPFVPGVESSVIDTTPDTFDADDWAMWVGTSFAAPQIAGLAARVCTETALTPRDACATIMATGNQIPDHGRALVILPGT